MRILILSWEYPPSVSGGMAAHVDGLSHALLRLGHEVVVITRRVNATGTHATRDGVQVIAADTSLPYIDGNAVATTASANHQFVATLGKLNGWRPDVVHAHNWNVGWAADAIAKMFEVPLVTTFHGTAKSRHGGHLVPGVATEIHNIEWWQAFQSDRVIATTRLLGREIVDGFELDPEQLVHIPTGIDPTWWQHGMGDIERRGGDRPLIFSWGRVQYEKGFQVLARAIGTLRGRFDNLECVIAGRGSYLPELQSQIDLAQAGEVIDLAGYMPAHELRRYVHQATCVVIPSLYEPFGVVALEAAAGGAPVIVSNTGGLRELVGQTGMAEMFEPGNADDLAERIADVIANPQLAAAISQRAVAVLRERYSWDAVASTTADVYERVAAR